MRGSNQGLKFFKILYSSLVLSSIQLSAVYDGGEGLGWLPPPSEESLGLGDLLLCPQSPRLEVEEVLSADDDEDEDGEDDGHEEEY